MPRSLTWQKKRTHQQKPSTGLVPSSKQFCSCTSLLLTLSNTNQFSFFLSSQSSLPSAISPFPPSLPFKLRVEEHLLIQETPAGHLRVKCGRARSHGDRGFFLALVSVGIAVISREMSRTGLAAQEQGRLEPLRRHRQMVEQVVQRRVVVRVIKD